jgi:XapX domain-containing protein
MKFLIGFLISFLVGAGCRFFDIPSPSPPVLPGALLVVAVTLGYTVTDHALKGKERVATTKHLCGGPSGLSASATALKESEAARHL